MWRLLHLHPHSMELALARLVYLSTRTILSFYRPVMKRIILTTFSFLIALEAGAACFNDGALNKILSTETAYMLGRIPPAFADAVNDKLISFKMSDAAEGCGAELQITLPENDVKQAQQLLDRDPAKKIILFSQGYTLPESSLVSAKFNVDAATLQPKHEDILQTGELGKLRASVEMMYAMLTQERANIEANAVNKTAWSSQFKQQFMEKCSKEFSQSSAQACECQADKISGIATERQISYVDYINSNPYSHGTGAGKSYAILKRDVDASCGLRK